MFYQFGEGAHQVSEDSVADDGPGRHLRSTFAPILRNLFRNAVALCIITALHARVCVCDDTGVRASVRFFYSRSRNVRTVL